MILIARIRVLGIEGAALPLFPLTQGSFALYSAALIIANLGRLMEQNLKFENGLIFKPLTGTILAVSSGLSFFFLCMILPLVGPAGSRVDHAAQNKAAFLLVLFATFALAALATWSKLGRRKNDNSAYPWFSITLCGICVLTLIVLLLGGFAI